MNAIITAVQSVVAMPAYQEQALAQAPDIARRLQGALGAFFGYDFHLCESGPQLTSISRAPRTQRSRQPSKRVMQS